MNRARMRGRARPATINHIELGGGRRGAPGFGFMSGIDRYNGVGGYGRNLTIAAAMAWTSAEAEEAQEQARVAPCPFQPKFFTRNEYATVIVLTDLIIPKDERSGSASDAGVLEFMESFLLASQCGGFWAAAIGACLEVQFQRKLDDARQRVG